VFQSWPKPINHARFACSRNEFKVIIKEILGSTGKLGGEVSDRLRIHLALVPLLENFEVRAAGFPVLAALPTIAGQEIRGRRQYVRRAAQQVAAAIAVEIH